MIATLGVLVSAGSLALGAFSAPPNAVVVTAPGQTTYLDDSYDTSGALTVRGAGTVVVPAGARLEVGSLHVDLCEGSFVNEGEIEAVAGGEVRVEAPEVRNTGSIRAFSGTIVLKGESVLASGRLDASAPLSGDGGFVEVSSRGALAFEAKVDASAPHGRMGTFLLDPKFIVVQTSGGAAYSNGTNNLFGNAPSTTQTITPASIDAAAANIVLQANTDITVNDALVLTSAGKTLTLQAGRSILLNANVSTTNGAISMTANDNSAGVANRALGSGNLTAAAGTSISSGTAAITLTIGPLNPGFTPGTVTLAGVSGNSLLVAATTPATTFNGTVTTAGNQMYATPIFLTNDTVLTSSAGAIDFQFIVDGAHVLTVSSANATFAYNVGTMFALTALFRSGSGTTIVNGNVTTTGDQSWGVPTLLASGVTLDAGTAGTITLNGGSTAGDVTLAASSVSFASGILATPPGATTQVTLRNGGVTEGAGAALVTGNLVVQGTGSLTLDQPANDSATLAAQLVGPLFYRDTNALTIGPIGSVPGISTGNGGTPGADVTVHAAGPLTVLGPVDTSIGGGGVLTVVGDVTLSAGVTLGAGNITLTGVCETDAAGPAVTPPAAATVTQSGCQ